MSIVQCNPNQVSITRISALALLSLASATNVFAQPATRTALLPLPTVESCKPAPTNIGSAKLWLGHAAAEVLPPNSTGKVLRLRSNNDQLLWEQSDRMYEPFIPNMQSTTRWYDPATGVEGKQPIERPVGKVPSVLSSADAVFAGRDTVVMPVAQLFPFSEPERQLNPWAVLRSWQQTLDTRAEDVRVADRCVQRDYPRVVLTRPGANGIERLYLDEYSAAPVQFSRTEPHYLWGQVRADYQWGTWVSVDGGGSYPHSAHRLIDGYVYGRQANPAAQLISADSAPKLVVPRVATPMSTNTASLPAPDTVRVSANTFLLVTRAYTIVVTLQKDTVFVLDATTAEERARADSTWISRLFPGKHPVVLVVTDLAWPHISGVRFWAAQKTPIVTHALSTDFLQRVVDRRWTLKPDLLEQQRGKMRMVLNTRIVRDSMRLAGGAVVAYPIRGVASEGALLVSIPGEKFVWAGDYVQRVDQPTQYAREVVKTLTTLGITPDRIAAQHLPLTSWSAVLKNNSDNAIAPRGGIFPR